MARIDTEELERVATLARLELADDERASLAQQLERILEHAELLQELDTSGIEATAHAIPLPTPLRPDEPAPPMDPELALANAPERAGTAFVVPKVIEDDEEG